MRLASDRIWLGMATLVGSLAFAAGAAAQAEVAAWGNLEGIRMQGELMRFETGVCLLRPDGSEQTRTAKERQRPRYRRDGAIRRVDSSLGGVTVREVVEDLSAGVARIDLTVAADTQGIAAATVFCVDLPLDDFASGEAQPLGAEADRVVELAALEGGQRVSVRAEGVRFRGDDREVEVRFDEPVALVLRRSGRDGGSIRLDALLLPPGPARGDSVSRVVTLRVSGEVDRAPVELVLDADRPDRAFDGLGGNFRLQNPTVDPPVVAYNLANLRLSWGRVEMPWRSWHPDAAVDPLTEARAGRIDERSRRSMEMARELARRGMKVVVSVWFPPAWTVVGGGELPRQPGGPPGDPLDPARMEQIHASLAGYLVFLKEEYGVEAALFSFNESDLGIDVRQTAAEHAAFIRGFGAYLGERGLATRMLLGDTSDGTAMEFIGPAMEDPEALRYVGAVSFHSWRGWSDEILRFWGDAARQLNVPLLVGEGSTDAGAWRYPAIFAEPAFALQEIELYTRMMALAQPLSILQWQLTGDYSLLAGGGVFGDTTALRPTQRFWNYKQLASSPAGFHLPLQCKGKRLACAAVADIASGRYALHVVNTGAAREATLRGLPSGLSTLRMYVTDASRGMAEVASVPVTGGAARLPLPAASFVTLEGEVDE